MPQAPRIPVWSLHGRISTSVSFLRTPLRGYKAWNAPIGSGTRQHLVDTDDVERMRPYTHVEGVLAGGLGDILVGADTGGFESFRRKLLVLVGDQVAAEGELVDGCTLTAKIENTDLRAPACKSDIVRIVQAGEMKVPWSREHHGCTSTWGTACSCSNGSNGRDGDPFCL